MEIKVYFVILHYQTFEETVECVNSILKNINYENKHIVVVDNNSPNKSGIYITDYYANNDIVKVIINNENLGFAKGNNVGYSYAKKHGAEFIVQVNSDTIFLDNIFIDKLIKIYDEKKYGVLGPQIVSISNGEQQNPLINDVKTIDDINKKIITYKIRLILSYLNLDNFVVNKILNKSKDNPSSAEEYIDDSESKSMLLHGCCLIFSPDYIKSFEGMFSGTFMYYEEQILYYNCKKKGLKMLYSKKLKLYHKRNASTKVVYTKDIKRRRFMYKESLKSLAAFRNYILSER